MTDLTPLHDLIAEWGETGHESQGGDSPEVDELRRWHIFQLNQAIATVEAANPWIPVEKGLPEPSENKRYDVWLESGRYSLGCRKIAPPGVPWLTSTNHGLGDTVTHYRRHVPEKGPAT